MSVQTKAKHVRNKILVIDDHPAIRDALSVTINDTFDMEVCGVAKTASEALDKIGELKPEVAVVDISLEDAHGLDLVHNIRNFFPDVQVIVFSMYDEQVYAERAIRAGAVGYLMKSESTKTVVEAVRAAIRGEIYLSKATSSRILHKMVKGNQRQPSFPIDDLKDREMAVFQMLGQGSSIKEIEDKLNLSRKTVETYRRRVKEKLGFETVAELLQFAVQWTYGQGQSTPEQNGQ